MAFAAVDVLGLIVALFSRTVSFRSRVLPPNSVWMEDAKLKGLEICHPQVITLEGGRGGH